MTARVKQIACAADVEEALMLAGKTRGWQIFRGGRTAYGDRNIGAVFAFELSIGVSDLAAQPVLVGSCIDYGAGFSGSLGEIRNPLLVDLGKEVSKLIPGSGLRQRITIGCRGQGKAVRNPDALRRKRGIKLAEGSRLASHEGNVFEA